ncbi:putative disease resistance protein RGA4 [Solanum pennellii]|uniref:Disease resistance protein RGA4 n=1 Tax=Solanum pennellii TaxID=28526 RepID=A0ABM1V9G2_SOLPN|nr:putative disease resistance protein RGA4 [Solanum pennellii]
MDQLQGCLGEVLQQKRYLLVLDDVWNEDQHKWTDMRELLMNCSRGSKIVVTTRSKMVALITGTVPPYYLRGLGQDNLFPNLVEIGKEIVKKCGGVPLAVKTLGRLLYMKTDKNEWLQIRDNEIWEIEQNKSDILPILRLSYEQMPSHLRQCFAYCPMLPKGQEIPREDFINRWAQGFIQSSNRNRKLEDIGNQYFDELLSRFCFLDVVQAFDGEILACKIHNLVHDLAQSVSGAECLNVKPNAFVVSERVRHLFFHAEDMSRKYFPRFLLPLHKPELVQHFTALRLLRIYECPSLCSLPSSIRYLTSLEKLWIWNCEELDLIDREGMSGLTSLQSLLLMGLPTLVTLPLELKDTAPTTLKYFRIADCPYLVELPEWLPNCSSLQRLYIEDCPVLASIPQGIYNHNANVHIIDCPLLGG